MNDDDGYDDTNNNMNLQFLCNINRLSINRDVTMCVCACVCGMVMHEFVVVFCLTVQLFACQPIRNVSSTTNQIINENFHHLLFAFRYFGINETQI